MTTDNDEVREWLRSLFGDHRPDDETPTPPEPPGIVPAEGANPQPQPDPEQELRDLVRGMFGRPD